MKIRHVGPALILVLTACSRDGSEMASLAAAPVRHASGESRRLAVDTMQASGWPGNYGSVSRDGRLMSGIDQETGNLVIRDLETGVRRLVTNDPRWTNGKERNVLSPSGSMVAFVRYGDGASQRLTSELRTIGADGTGERTLHRTSDVASYVAPRDWSPDEQQLLVLAANEDKSHQIALLSVAGGPLRVLKSLSWQSPEGLKFSPNGRAIAYDLPLKQDATGRDLYILNVDGSRESRVTSDANPKALVGWSSDGNALLYTTRSDGALTLWSQPVRDGRASAAPVVLKADLWSAAIIDARAGRVFYRVQGTKISLNSVQLDPRGPRVLGTPEVIEVGADIVRTGPLWSRDGGQMLFVRKAGPLGRSRESIVIRDVAMNQEREVPLVIEYVHPIRWEPDGRSLIALARQRGQLAMYRVDLATGDARPFDSDADGIVDFSPDGATMYLSHAVAMVRGAGSLSDGGKAGGRLLVRRIRGGEERELVRADRVNYQLSPDGRTLVLLSETISEAQRREAERQLSSFIGSDARVLLWPEATEWARSFGNAFGWSADSRSILFRHVPPGGDQDRSEIRVAVVGASESRTLLVTSGQIVGPITVAPDGRRLTYWTQPKVHTEELWVFATTTDRASTLPADSVALRRIAVDSGSFDEIHSVSRDGRWVTGLDAKTIGVALLDTRTGARRLVRVDSGTPSREAEYTLISPDGRRIAFVWAKEDKPSEHPLRVIDADGSNERTVWSSSETDLLMVPFDWAPDGRALLALRHSKDDTRQIVLVSLTDGRVQTLKSLEWRYPRAIRFSPDGRRVAYDAQLQKGTSERGVFVLDVDGSREVRITSATEQATLVGWSSHGIYYFAWNGRAASLRHQPLRDGRPTGEARLIRSDLWDMDLVGLTSTGLLGAVDLSPRQVSVWSVDSMTGRLVGQPTRVSSGNDIPLWGLQWSPDGNQIAFTRFVDNGQTNLAISIHDLGGGQEQSIETPFRVFNLLQWREPGAMVVATSVPGGRDFHRVDLASGKATSLAVGENDVWYPASSADGSTVYTLRSTKRAGEHAIVVRRLADTQEREIFRGSVVGGLHPSGDGARVAFLSRQGPDSTTAIHIIGQTGGEGSNHGTPRPSDRIEPGSLTWGPGGRLLYVIRNSDSSEIWELSLPAGTMQRRTAKLGERLALPTLSRDGKRLAYITEFERKVRELWLLEGLTDQRSPVRP